VGVWKSALLCRWVGFGFWLRCSLGLDSMWLVLSQAFR